MKIPVYMDYAATTPVDPRVVEAMAGCLGVDGAFANPSSSHAPGRTAAALMERARAQVARLINAAPRELVWTSGATEANNLALIGTARFRARRGRHIVTARTEHPAVLDSCRYLESQGGHVTYLQPDSQGIIDPGAVESALRADTILVSIMHVNNEIGVVQDISAIGQICRRHDVLFHVDAAQSGGRLPIDVREQAIDLLSLSGHKMYGPKGVGALFLNAGRVRRIEPLHFGGGQERGLRPGTLPTHQLVGMGLACQIAGERIDADSAHIGGLCSRLWSAISALPGVLQNGHPTRRAAHILSVSVTGVEGESLRFGLKDLAVSSGSACASASAEPSPVLRALGRSDPLAQSSLRFSLGRPTTVEEIDFAAERFIETVTHLRGLAPVSRVALA